MHRHLVCRQGHVFSAADLPAVLVEQAGAMTGANRDANAQVGQAKVVWPSPPNVVPTGEKSAVFGAIGSK